MLGLPAARSAFQRASKSPVRPGASSTRMPYSRSNSRLCRSVAAPGAPKNDQTTTPSFLAAATTSSHDPFACARAPLADGPSSPRQRRGRRPQSQHSERPCITRCLP